uniref:AB hydrolase-1 domain-containing protein n=1 Tax=Glossina austeni TaxID=7395 RepID=A0A1A9UKI9_GLOAU
MDGGLTRRFDIIDIISHHLPNKSILVGWSLGGLIASQIAIQHPKKFYGLIIISSSPYFCEEKNWPGIKHNSRDAIKSGAFNKPMENDRSFLFLNVINFFTIDAIIAESRPPDNNTAYVNFLHFHIETNFYNNIDIIADI